MITIESVSVQLQYRKCNKRYCKACKSGGHHGPYYYAFKMYKRRVFSCYIGKVRPADMQPIYAKLAAKIERIIGNSEVTDSACQAN